MFDSNVVFADIPDYEGRYMVTSCGRIWSHKANRFMSPRISEYGYCLIVLTGLEKPKSFRIHRLVAEAFLPNPVGLEYVNHINADRTCNHVWNLEWISPRDNLAHAVKLGNRDFVRNNPLPDDVVREIKRRYVKGCDVNGKLSLAREFDVKPEIVRQIVNGISYRNVE